VVVEGVKGVKNAPMPPKIYEHGKNTGGFPHFLASKWPKTPLFAQKYLTRYTPETFFEEYINFKSFHSFKPLWSYTCSKFSEVIYAPSRPD
jgi:hypothetical protein